MKKIIVSIIVIVIGFFAWFKFSGQAEELLIKTLERQGRRSFGTEVTVSNLDLNIRAGTATIGQIEIANPPGFSQKNAMTLASIHAQFDYKTLSIREIIIAEPQINAEHAGTKFNIRELSKHAELFDPRKAQKKPSSGSTEENDNDNDDSRQSETTDQVEEDPINLTIDYFAMENISVNLISDQLDQNKQFNIEQISARDLSGTPGEIGNQFINQMLSKLYTQITKESLKTLGDDKLEALKNKVKDNLKSLFQ